MKKEDRSIGGLRRSSGHRNPERDVQKLIRCDDDGSRFVENGQIRSLATFGNK